MQTLLKIISGFFLAVPFFCCSNNSTNESQLKFQGDTLNNITEATGDTVFRKSIRSDNQSEENYIDTSIYFSKSIDQTIVKSNFYFTRKGFKIYFDREKVIAYCDSIIKGTPPDTVDGEFVNWSTINSMERLKKQAESDKKMEEELASWLSSLLERLNPLIVNEKSYQIPNRLLKEKFLSKTERYRKYSAINQLGDTAFICFEQDYLELKLKEVDNRNGM